MAMAAPAPTEQDLEAAARRLGEVLVAHDWRLATAESSTGGLIGHAITMVPGSSRYYAGGVISYSDWAKHVQLGVSRELTAEHGAVSGPVAAAMAEGVRDRFGVELGAAVTGIAGPDGATPGKPVGLHFVSVALRGHPPATEERVFAHDRDGNKFAAALLTIELALREARAAGGP
jgi:PncC family amidohydrolase